VLTGSGFADGDAVSFGPGVLVHSVSVEGPNQITASVSVAAAAALSSRNVVVTQGTANGSCTGCFTVSDTPFVAGVTVPTLPQGAVDQSLQVQGSNFMPRATVTFGAGSGVTVDGVSYQSPFQLMVTISVASTASVQTDNVTVTNKTTGAPSGTCAGCFAVSDTPVVTSVFALSPGFPAPTASLPQGAAQQSLQVQGSNFTTKASVSFGAGSGVTVKSLSYESPYQLSITISVASTALLQTDNVTVTNKTTGSPSGTCTGCLIVSDTPTVSFVQTAFNGFATLPQGAANQTVTVFGSNFMPKATVSFGAGSGITVTSVSYQNPYQLSITISVAPSALLQTDNVTVTNKTAGSPTGTCTGCFGVSDTPTFVNLNSGIVSPGATDIEQYVYGQNFQGDATVSLNPATGITINSVRFENPGELIVNMTVALSVPSESVDVTVTNPSAPTPNSGTCLGCLSVT
jgi:hypothetical protein